MRVRIMRRVFKGQDKEEVVLRGMIRRKGATWTESARTWEGKVVGQEDSATPTHYRITDIFNT